VNKPKDIDEAVKRMGGATPEDIRRYTVKASKLKEPASRLWPDIEAYSAAALREQIGSVRCVGDDWYVQRDGVWYPKKKDEFRAIALSVIPNHCRTHDKCRNVLSRLEDENQVPADVFCGAYKFDHGEILLSITNGVLRISADDVTLERSNGSHNFTSLLPVEWDSSAECVAYQQQLVTALPDGRDRELFLDILSTALIPDCRFETALVCIGETGTGKSTAIAPIENIFGTNCSTVSMADLCNPNGYKLAMLHNKMINITTELQALEMDDSGMFKQLVSGETFPARKMYGHPFDMRSTAKLIFLANSLPRFKNGTGAEARRIPFVRFDQKPDEPDPTLKDRMRLEAQGLFTELVGRAQHLLTQRSLSQSGEYGDKTRERFGISNDPVGSFVKTHCVLGTDQ
jgi:P4 family phage/plasmid primase-like protien